MAYRLSILPRRSPTQQIWFDAGYEDGLKGATVVGNTEAYLRGYGAGEAARQARETR